MKSGTFTLDADSLKESFTVLAKKLAGKWNRGAVDSNWLLLIRRPVSTRIRRQKQEARSMRTNWYRVLWRQ